MLYQKQEGKMRVMGFGSRVLTPAVSGAIKRYDGKVNNRKIDY